MICFVNRGAGQEVGRSCILLEFKGKKVMVKIYKKKTSFFFTFRYFLKA